MKKNAVRVFGILALAVVYFLAARLGLLLAFRHTNVSPVWPPTGISFAALWLLGVSFWPGIWLGAFSANFFTGLSLSTSLAIATGNTIEAVAGFLLMKRVTQGRNPLQTSRDVFGFLLFPGLISTAIGATIGTTSVYFGGFNYGASYRYLWWTWWLGDSVGNIVVAPLILAVAATPLLIWDRARKLEAALLLVTLVFVGQIVFSSSFSVGVSLAYLTLPLIVVAAFRFEQRGAAVAVVILSAIAIRGTTNGHGPFRGDNLNESLLLLQIFIGTIAATALILAAVVNESRKTQGILKSSLEEKEILLREIHHRVKNNLQVVSSLLSMQSRNVTDENMLKTFRESESRIKAMALVHEKLYGTEEFGKVHFAQYLKTLAEDLLQSYCQKPEIVRLDIKAEGVMLDINRAVPLGLIVNELITNSCKYAFLNGRPGEIAVEWISNSETQLIVRDNGPGLPADFNLEEVKSLGLRLVTILVRQLEGTISIQSGPTGTSFQMAFPFGQS